MGTGFISKVGTGSGHTLPPLVAVTSMSAADGSPPLLLLEVSIRRTFELHSAAQSSTSCRQNLTKRIVCEAQRNYLSNSEKQTVGRHMEGLERRSGIRSMNAILNRESLRPYFWK